VKREEILKLAGEAVTKRNLTYGEPEQSFEKIAELWLAWLRIRKNEDLGAVDVAILLLLMKVGRLVESVGHVDTFVDIAGYAACAGELATSGDGVEQGNETRNQSS
jgi:hypothetical protein